MTFKKFFKESPEDLQEVSQSPASLEAFLNSPEAEGMRFGFEAEVIMTGFEGGYADESEIVDEDIGRHETVSDVSSFFSAGTRTRSYSDLESDFYEWLSEKEEDYKRSYIEDNLEARAEELFNKLSVEEQEEYEIEDFYGAARSELESEAEEDFSNNDDYGFYEFCQAKGYRTYYDLSNAYGFDWPDDRYESSSYGYDEETGYSLERAEEVASELGDALDISVKAYNSYHGGQFGAHSELWRIEPDGSLETKDPESEAGMEIITPDGGLPLKEGITAMQQLFSWLRAKRAYTSEDATTGLHINLSIPDQYKKTIDYVKLVLFSGDEYVLQQFDRVGGYNDESAREIRRAIERGNVEEALGLMRKGLSTAASTSLIASNKGRSVTVNKKNNYVEFRVVGNDYLNMGEVVRLAVLRFARALTIAADPEAHKEEYAKKLYKVITNVSGKMLEGLNPDVVKMFAQTLSQLSYGPPTRETAQGIANLKARLLQTRMTRKSDTPKLPDRKNERGSTDSQFKAEALLNAKALELFLNYIKQTYGEDNSKLNAYLFSLKGADFRQIAAAFSVFWGDLDDFGKNLLAVFSPIPVIEKEKPELIGRTAGPPFFIELKPEKKKIFLANVIQNYS